MDREIAEQAAGRRDVGLVRRGRIVAGEANRVDRPERAGLDEAPCLAVPGVEPPLEAQLERDLAPVDLRRQRDRVAEVQGEGLFAERRQAASEGR